MGKQRPVGIAGQAKRLMCVARWHEGTVCEVSVHRPVQDTQLRQ